MEAVVGLVMLAVIILVLKLVGAWMLSITDVMKKQDTQIKGLVKINENLSILH